MTYSDFLRRASAFVAIATFVVVFLVTISRLVSVILLVFFCWVLSVGLNAIIHRLERYGFQRGAAGIITFLSIIIVILLLITIVIPPFISQATSLVADLPGAIRSLVEEYAGFRESLDNAFLKSILPEFSIQDYKNIFEPVEESDVLEEQSQGAIELNALINSALPIVGNIGSIVGSLIANTIFILIITAYLVADPLSYYRPLLAIVPKDYEHRIPVLINEIHDNVKSWMGGLAISITFTSVTVTLALSVLLQIPNAVALGVISGLAGFIPNIGYYIGLVPILIFTAAHDPAKVIPAMFLYWLISQIDGNYVTPSVMKNELNIPAGVILPFQLMAGAILGFYGILLAVPMLAILITLGRELFVFDILGKREHLTGLDEDEFGNVILVLAESTSNDENG